jgi:hypothetical protein
MRQLQDHAACLALAVDDVSRLAVHLQLFANTAGGRARTLAQIKGFVCLLTLATTNGKKLRPPWPTSTHEGAACFIFGQVKSPWRTQEHDEYASTRVHEYVEHQEEAISH